MRIRQLVIAVVVALAASTGPAAAAGPVAITDVLSPEEEAEVHAAADPNLQVNMYYNGQKIDPAGGWQGAAICAEVGEDGTMECFDNDTQANARLAAVAPTPEARQGAAEALAQEANTADSPSLLAYNDCPTQWVCLWQNANYSGRRLQWPTYSTAKTRHLDIYSPSFRDEASSAAVMRSQRGVTLYFRTGLPDPQLILASGYALWPNFSNYDYTYGGSWNDKADAIKF